MNASVLAFWVVASITGAPGDPPLVRYVSKVVTKSWEPIALAEVERMVEAKALAVLAASGTMRLEKSGYADLAGGDYALTIDGRFIEEAESFSVYLGFSKGKRDDLPSFHVSDNGALGGMQRQAMQKRIEELATHAGQKLVEVLAPRLEAARLSVPTPMLEDPQLPWTWGTVEVPKVSSPSKDVRTLLDPRNPDHERHKALTALLSQVFDQQPVRNAVERCVLTDPSSDIRGRCADALEAVARQHVPTQRIILAAMRQEIDDNVLRALTKISASFVGLSRKESIETWLELMASEATPGNASSVVADVLADEGDVPNLDLAVARCLLAESLAYGRKSACAGQLLRKIPETRRAAVVIPYLKRVEVWEQGERNAYGSVVELGIGRGSKPIDPLMASVFVDIALRASSGQARRDALYQLHRHPAPTPALVERFLPLVADPLIAIETLRTLREWVKDAPELAAMTLGALKRLRGTVKYLPRPSHENPYEAFDKTIAALESPPKR